MPPPAFQTVNGVLHALLYCPEEGDYAVVVVADLLHIGGRRPALKTGRCVPVRSDR